MFIVCFLKKNSQTCSPIRDVAGNTSNGRAANFGDHIKFIH